MKTTYKAEENLVQGTKKCPRIRQQHMQEETYKRIGARLNRLSKNPILTSQGWDLERYVKHFSDWKLPLYLVGWSGEDITKHLHQDVECSIPLRMLHPDLFLEFPQAFRFFTERAVTAPVIRVVEIPKECINDLASPEVIERAYKALFCEVLQEIPKEMFDRMEDEKFEWINRDHEDIANNIVHCSSFMVLLADDGSYIAPSSITAPVEPLDLIMGTRYCAEQYLPFIPFREATDDDREKIIEAALELTTPWWQLIHRTLLYIAMPQNIRVVEHPELTPHEQKYKNKDKKPRWDKRPRHIVINHQQWKTWYKDHNHDGRGAGVAKEPHCRKAHPVWLRNERYKDSPDEPGRKIWRRGSVINDGLKWNDELYKTTYEIID